MTTTTMISMRVNPLLSRFLTNRPFLVWLHAHGHRMRQNESKGPLIPCNEIPNSHSSLSLSTMLWVKETLGSSILDTLQYFVADNLTALSTASGRKPCPLTRYVM